MICRSVRPYGASNRPGRFTCPSRVYILVPGVVGAVPVGPDSVGADPVGVDPVGAEPVGADPRVGPTPTARYHAAPLAMMAGTAENVSTLLTMVGRPW